MGTQPEERPITHGPPAQPAQNDSLWESSWHFVQFHLKIEVLPKVLLISNMLCSWVLVFFPCFSKKEDCRDLKTRYKSENRGSD